MSSVMQKDTAYGLGVGLMIGSVFGAALEKGKVFLPQVIRQQMLFGSYQMLKVFLTATAVGVLVMSSLEHFGIHKRSSQKTSLGLGMMQGHGGNVIGGLLLGAGVTISGACPGTVMAQLGTGVWSAKWVLLGGYLGGISFGYLHGAFQQKNPAFLKKAESQIMDKYLEKPMWAVSLAVSAAFMSVVGVVEYLHPWQQDIVGVVTSAVSGSGLSIAPTDAVWSPLVAGAVIGLCQIPSMLLLQQALGASGSYVTMASFFVSCVDGNCDKNAPVFKTHRKFSDLAQVGTVTGIVLGSYLSATLSGVQVIQDPQTSPLTYAFGGFILILGARIAGGCASGHGISGVARLSAASIITTAAMFVGGISTALVVPLWM